MEKESTYADASTSSASSPMRSLTKKNSATGRALIRLRASRCSHRDASRTSSTSRRACPEGAGWPGRIPGSGSRGLRSAASHLPPARRMRRAIKPRQESREGFSCGDGAGRDPGVQATKPRVQACSAAQRVAWWMSSVALRRPSFARMWARCVSTVLMLRCSTRAISCGSLPCPSRR